MLFDRIACSLKTEISAMTGLKKNILNKHVAGVLAALAVLSAPVALYADASAPWATKKVVKKKAKPVARKRRSAVRSTQQAPRPAPQPEPQVAEVVPEAPVYTPPEPVYTPPPAPEVPVAVAPEAVAPAVAATSSGGGFPILAILGGVAAIGGIIALASSS